MAHDMARAIVSVAEEMSQLDTKNKRIRFLDAMTHAHYNICVEVYSKDVENIPLTHHLGCKQFYVVDGKVYMDIANTRKSGTLMKIDLDNDRNKSLLKRHYWLSNADRRNEDIKCLRLFITHGIYGNTKGKRVFKYWKEIEMLDYDPDTDIGDIVMDAMAFIKNIKTIDAILCDL